MEADKVDWLVPDKCPFPGFILRTFKLYWFHQGNKARMFSHRSKGNLKAGRLTHFSQGISHLVLLKVSVSSLSSLPCRNGEFMLFLSEGKKGFCIPMGPHINFLKSKWFPCLHFLWHVSVLSRPYTGSSLLHSSLDFFQSYFLFIIMSWPMLWSCSCLFNVNWVSYQESIDSASAVVMLFSNFLQLKSCDK